MPGTPASSIPGTPGTMGEAERVISASGTSLPARICGSTTGVVPIITCTSPASTACSEGAPP